MFRPFLFLWVQLCLKKKSKWFWPLPVLTYHLVVVCIIVIYLISIVASPALMKTVAPCRRLYCKPVWSFVFPPLVFGLSGSVMFTCTVSLNTLYFPSFLVLFSPRNLCTSTQIFLLLQLHRTPPSSSVVRVCRLLLLIWWLLQLILNLKNGKREHGNFSKWTNEEVLGTNQTLLDDLIVAWRETDRV